MATVSDHAIGIEARRVTVAGRQYQVDDQLLPSVTTILDVIGKPALVPWAGKVERELVKEAAANLYEDIANTPKMSRPAYLATLDSRIGKEKAAKRELEAASEIGSQAHGIIEWNLRKKMGQVVGPEPKICDKALWAFMSFSDWWAKVELAPIRLEQVVFSMRHGYAGTMDLLGRLLYEGKHRLAVIDFKTGKAVYSEAYLQVAAYRYALLEMGHERADIGLIVRLPKNETDPEFEVVPVPDMRLQFETFLHAKRVWIWREKQQAEYRRKIEAAKDATG